MKVILTVDTEADDQWDGSEKVTTKNLAFIPRFQALCEEYGMKPTYLCTYEVVVSDIFQTTLRAYQDAGNAEIGTHLHPWTNPPFSGGPGVTVFDKSEYPSYPSELPSRVFRDKMRVLTDVIAEKTGVAPTSYRAGRWGFSADHIEVLLDLGYTVDCSVTPLVDRSMYKGVNAYGPDYRTAPVSPYVLDARDVCRAGQSGLLEVPVTIVYTHPLMQKSALARSLFYRAKGLRVTGLLNRALRLEPSWFRPYPSMSTRRMKKVHAVASALELPVLEMMFHSSELMPGGSESFPTAQSIEKLFAMIRGTLAHLSESGCEGVTLSEFARDWQRRRAA